MDALAAKSDCYLIGDVLPLGLGKTATPFVGDWPRAGKTIVREDNVGP